MLRNSIFIPNVAIFLRVNIPQPVIKTNRRETRFSPMRYIDFLAFTSCAPPPPTHTHTLSPDVSACLTRNKAHAGPGAWTVWLFTFTSSPQWEHFLVLVFFFSFLSFFFFFLVRGREKRELGLLF